MPVVARYRRYKAERKCSDCGKGAGEFARCRPCRRKRFIRKQERLARGVPKWRA